MVATNAAVSGDTSSANGSLVIGKAPSTTTVTCPAGPYTYTGSLLTPCSASVTGAGGLSLTPTPDYLNNTNAGTATASYTYVGDANHTASSDSKSFTIDRASSTTTLTCASPVTYTGSPLTPCSASATGVGGLNEALLVTYGSNTNAGTGTANASFTGDANHTASSDSKTFTIDKAVSTTTVTCVGGPFTYTGLPQTPCSASATGVGGLNQALTVTYGNNTDAGSASASASFAGDANHEPSSNSTTFTIGKASSTTTVTCGAGPFTFNGSAQTPCAASVTGIGGISLSPTPSYADNTDAGTASASYTYAGDANHEGSSDTATFLIGKASSTVVIDCTDPVTYTGSPLTPCTAIVTRVGTSTVGLTVTYTDNTDAGTGNASASYDGDVNHDPDSNSTTFTIGKASSTTTVTCTSPVTYTGSPLTPCSASVTGAGGLNQALLVTYGSNTNAGTGTADASFTGDANHFGSSDSESFTIDRAPSTTTVTCGAGPFTYTGLPQTPCSASATGVGGLNQALTVTYGNNTDAGSASASASFAGDANHEPSSNSTTFTIGKATLFVDALYASKTYADVDPAFASSLSGFVNGETEATASVSGLVDCSRSNDDEDAGLYVDVITCAPSSLAAPNYTFVAGSSADFEIFPAPTTTTVTCPAGPFTFNGSPQTPCSASVTGPGGLNQTLTVGYSDNTDAGTAYASASYAGAPNYQSSSNSETFTIGKAPSTTTVTCPAGPYTYTGSLLTPCSASVTGAGGLSLTPTPGYLNNTNAGTASRELHLCGRRQPHRQQRQQVLHDRQGLVDDDT